MQADLLDTFSFISAHLSDSVIVFLYIFRLNLGTVSWALSL